MTTVFLGGSRAIELVPAEVALRLGRIVEQRLPVIVGDAKGADLALQRFFRGAGYPLVEVFCTGGRCRNNVGSWRVRNVLAPPGTRGFGFYAAKDRVMADEATVGMMLWDGQSAGTVMNVLRLVRRKKKAVVHIGPTSVFVEVKNEADWERFLGECSMELRRKLEREAAGEREVLRVPTVAAG